MSQPNDRSSVTAAREAFNSAYEHCLGLTDDPTATDEQVVAASEAVGRTYDAYRAAIHDYRLVNNVYERRAA